MIGISLYSKGWCQDYCNQKQVAATAANKVYLIDSGASFCSEL